MKAWSLLLITGIVLPVIVFSEPIHMDLDFVRVNYDYDNEYGRAASPYGSKEIKWVTVPELSIPENIGEEPLFGELPISGKMGGLAFCVAKGQGSEWYEELYIDVDEDGAISDNERYNTKAKELKKVHIHPGGMFSPVLSVFPLAIPVNLSEKEKTTHNVELHVEVHKERYKTQRPRIYLANAGYRQGYTVIGGNKYVVKIIDSFFNGRFDDFSQLDDNGRCYGDKIVFILEGDEYLENLRGAEQLSRLRVIDNTIYNVSVVPDGSQLTLETCDIPCGYLKVDPVAEEINLTSQSGAFRLRRSKLNLLPAGEYRLANIIYEQKKNGREWRVYAYFHSGYYDVPKITISSGKTTEIPYGAPFTVKVSYEYSRKGSVNMDINLVGRSGEEYHWSCKGDEEDAACKIPVTIRGKSGKVLAHLVWKPGYTELDMIVPPSCVWEGPVPRSSAVATCEMDMPWKVFQNETIIRPQVIEKK